MTSKTFATILSGLVRVYALLDDVLVSSLERPELQDTYLLVSIPLSNIIYIYRIDFLIY